MVTPARRYADFKSLPPKPYMRAARSTLNLAYGFERKPRWPIRAVIDLARAIQSCVSTSDWRVYAQYWKKAHKVLRYQEMRHYTARISRAQFSSVLRIITVHGGEVN